jgi:hypothetical protein
MAAGITSRVASLSRAPASNQPGQLPVQLRGKRLRLDCGLQSPVPAPSTPQSLSKSEAEDLDLRNARHTGASGYADSARGMHRQAPRQPMMPLAVPTEAPRGEIRFVQKDQTAFMSNQPPIQAIRCRGSRRGLGSANSRHLAIAIHPRSGHTAVVARPLERGCRVPRTAGLRFTPEQPRAQAQDRQSRLIRGPLRLRRRGVECLIHQLAQRTELAAAIYDSVEFLIL